VISTATNEHPDVIIKACDAGKAVFTEKELALTNEGAEAMKAAVIRNNTRFGISFPHLSESPVMFALDAVKSGKLGQVNYVRFRKAHNGSTGDWLPPHFYDPVACGGGAMIDLGAHPMYMCCEVMGQDPVKIQSSFTEMTGRGVEDNAVSILTFADGSIGVSETSFVSAGYPLTLEIGGTEGTLMFHNGDVHWSCAEIGNKWTKVENLPERKLSPLEQWALATKPEDIPESFGIEAACRLTRVMVMAYNAK
jgi:predicted dehydrogenase